MNRAPSLHVGMLRAKDVSYQYLVCLTPQALTLTLTDTNYTYSLNQTSVPSGLLTHMQLLEELLTGSESPMRLQLVDDALQIHFSVRWGREFDIPPIYIDVETVVVKDKVEGIQGFLEGAFEEMERRRVEVKALERECEDLQEKISELEEVKGIMDAVNGDEGRTKRLTIFADGLNQFKRECKARAIGHS